jgi:hypothetical protein
METLILIALVAGVSHVITRECCRRIVARGRRPAIWVALVGAVGSPLLVVLLMTLLINGREMFTSHFWRDDLIQIQFIICMLAGTFIGLLPGVGVVLHYRQTSPNPNAPSEPR